MTTRGKWLDNRLHKNRVMSKLKDTVDAVPQCFQISVNILEGKRLAWANPNLATSYVMLVLDKGKYQTSVRSNMKIPVYRESFVFEQYTTVKHLLRCCLWLGVMEMQHGDAPQLLGESNIGLEYVWAQPNHTVTHKWAQLANPNNADCPAGYLKVDICIAYRGEIMAAPGDYQGIEEGILPSGPEQPASYHITLYRAYSLPCGINPRPHAFGKPPSTRARVTFCGLTGETSVQFRTNDPVYSERVTIVEMFPSAGQLVQLEVVTDGASKTVLGRTQLNLAQISHKGENGFLPTFGPSLLHMYGPWSSDPDEDGPYYHGALLIALKTVVPDYKQTVRTVTVDPVMVTQPAADWLHEDFVLFCPIFEASMLDKKVSGPVTGIAITMGDSSRSSSVDQDFMNLITDINKKKLHFTGPMPVRYQNPVSGNLKLDTFPVLQQATRLPDFRFRMYRNNVLHGIVNNLERDLANISTRLMNYEFDQLKDLMDALHRSKDDTAAKIQKFLDIVEYSNSDGVQKHSTELDRKIVELQKERINKIYRRITSKSHNACTPQHCTKNRDCEDGEYKRRVKRMLAEGKLVVEDLKELIFKTPDGWPDISIWLLSNGSRVAYAKVSAADVVHSVIPEQSGRRCGGIQTVYLKTLDGWPDISIWLLSNGSRVAYAKLSAADVVHSVIPEQSGHMNQSQRFGGIQTVYLKPIKCPVHPSSRCYCIAAKVELLLWLGAFRQRCAFKSSLPLGYLFSTEHVNVKCDPLSLECCVFIYRAKLKYTSDQMCMSPFVRINYMNDVKDTEVQHNTSNPVWNEVLRISCFSFTSLERLETSPPEMLVEIYHRDSTQTGIISLLGRLRLMPAFAANPEDAPALEWLEIDMGTEHIGKIQMSAQLIQIPASILKNSWPNAPSDLIPNMNQRSSYQVAQLSLNPEGRETLPISLLPVKNTYRIDVYWWGLRNISRTHKPCVTLELEDAIVKSTIITDCKPNCNFSDDRISQTFQGDLTNSPLTINLYDTTTFGRTTFVGWNVVKRPMKYVVNWIPKTEREQTLLMRPIITNGFVQVDNRTLIKRHAIYTISEDPDEIDCKDEINSKTSFWGKFFPKPVDEEEITLLPSFFNDRQRQSVVKKAEDDWWKRYYESLNDRTSTEKEPIGNRLTIYDSELEVQPGFSRFKDWCSTIKIYNGNKTGIPEKDEQLICGYLKASIAVYEWPPPACTMPVSNSGVDLDRGYFDGHPDNDPTRYLVRVYAVKCSSLVSKGFTTSSKCFVTVQCGNKELGDRHSSVPRNAEPVFGKMFELQCTFPEEYLLKVSVMDCGSSVPESLIGCTSIDLEDRAYTRHRCTVGLSAEYKINGPNRWRDSQRPSAILEELCAKNHLPPPQYPEPSTVLLNGVEYKDLGIGLQYASPLIRKESICLSILHKWHTLPICGYKLVPEHVEARTLYDPEKPGIEQGKIHLWIDMFTLDCGRVLPPPVDITPRPAEDYELRVIVWEVQDVKLVNRCSNIYVRTWIGPSDLAQDTEIYYKSTNGEGYFNWRMIFQFQYRHTERKLLLHEKGPFTEVTELFPPILIVQVMDIEAPNPEDFLGTLMLNLLEMPRGAQHSRQCTPNIMRKQDMDLFVARSCRGWWPLKMVDRNTGNYYFAGMIHLEISLLPREKALIMPVGIGRDAPAPLPDPMRDPSLSSVGSQIVQCCFSPALLILLLVCMAACAFWIILNGSRISKLFEKLLKKRGLQLTEPVTNSNELDINDNKYNKIIIFLE